MDGQQAALREFIRIVDQMRHWQKEFFQAAPGTTTRRQALDKSRALERQCDAWLADFKNPQQELFAP